MKEITSMKAHENRVRLFGTALGIAGITLISGVISLVAGPFLSIWALVGSAYGSLVSWSVVVDKDYSSWKAAALHSALPILIALYVLGFSAKSILLALLLVGLLLSNLLFLSYSAVKAKY